jgi:DNA-directed RNA polymerase I subunit RPA1
LFCFLSVKGKTEQTDENANQADLFFFDTIAVPPSKFRPVSQFKEQKFENPQTVQLSKLVAQNLILRDILIEIINLANQEAPNSETVAHLDKSEPSIEQTIHLIHTANKIAKKAPSVHEKLQNAWLQLQQLVNNVYDSDLDKLSAEKAGGLKQLLEKKEGLFRKHMMGKRVNYAGRSVISPDVFIGKYIIHTHAAEKFPKRTFKITK